MDFLFTSPTVGNPPYIYLHIYIYAWQCSPLGCKGDKAIVVNIFINGEG